LLISESADHKPDKNESREKQVVFRLANEGRRLQPDEIADQSERHRT